MLKPLLSELIINNDQNESAFAETFVYEPETIDEERLGAFYIVGEATTTTDSRAEPTYLLNLIASKSVRKFYEHRPGQTTKKAFSETLKEINHILFDLMDKGELDWLEALHLTLFALKNNQLYFAQSGRNATLLLRQNQLSDIGKVFTPHGGMLEDEQFFKNIASGTLIAGDQLLIATPKLLQNLSEQEVVNLLTRYSIEQYQNQSLARGLMKDYNINSLAAIVFWFTEAPAFKAEKRDKAVSATPTHIRVEAKPKVASQLIKLARLLRKLPRLLPKLPKKSAVSPEPPLPTLSPAKKMAAPKLIKYLLPILAAALIGAGAWLMFNSRLSETPERQLSDLKTRLDQILVTSLTDPQNTRALLDEVSEQASILSEKTNTSQLQDSITQAGFLIPITNLREGQPIIDFETLSLSFQPRGVIANPNRLIVYSQNDIYVYDLGTKQGSFLTLPKENVPLLKDGAYADDSEINYILNRQELLTIKGEPAQIATSETALPEPDAQTLAVATFGENVYLLTDSRQGAQIVKYAQGSTEQPIRWLKQDAQKNIISPIDIAIDGSIWVLERSGEIKKFTKGKFESQIKLPINEKFTNGAKLWTKSEAEYPFIWVLAPKLHRLLVIRKDGNLEGVFAASNILSPRDFVIHNNNIYIVSGLSVSRMELPLGKDGQ